MRRELHPTRSRRAGRGVRRAARCDAPGRRPQHGLGLTGVVGPRRALGPQESGRLWGGTGWRRSLAAGPLTMPHIAPMIAAL